MLPLVIEYLKSHTFRQLEEDHGVCARPNATFDKFSLNYDQILVKNGDPVAEQCRGMVVRPADFALFERAVAKGSPDSWKDVIVGVLDVLAWPMNRFYNHGDPAGAEVDWSDENLRVYEKLDGTMMVVYWDPLHERWHAGTRSVPEADLPIRKDHMEIGDTTFSGLFLLALKKTRQALSGDLTWEAETFDKVVHLNKELTYVFELTSPYNRVVVKYDEPRVTLLAARHTKTGKELAIEQLRLQHVQRPKVWELRSAAALDAFVNAADPALLEGAVVCDSQFRRLKVKNKAWILSSKAKDLVTVSRRSALLAIIKGEIDDVIPLVEKDIADELLSMQDCLREYMRTVDAKFHTFKTTANGSRRDFALQVTSSGDWTPPYFNMWEGKATSALEWTRAAAESGKLADSSLDLLLKLIK